MFLEYTHQMIQTKIIATLGPASESATVLRKMMEAGLDVVRINFSHGTHEDHARRIKMVRVLNTKHHRHLRILGDLEGPRIRIGIINNADGMNLTRHQVVILSNEIHASEGNRIPLDYTGSLVAIKKGYAIYIDDGNILLQARTIMRRAVQAEVVIPGILKTHKGVNIPDAHLRFPILSDKDKKDLEFAASEGLDYIAQSFVRGRRDMLAVKEFCARKNFHPGLIAKIENGDGIRNLKHIVQVSDGIMIARGDLGVSLPIADVPLMQKEIIRECRRQGKFSITATQMLESMTVNHRPTRAEASDVCNAVLDGSGFLMLSAETAVGKYPSESVGMMNEIIRVAERNIKQR
jgi:pyruvate kinase